MKDKSSLEIAIENGEELIEYFKDKWTPEQLDRQLKLLELSKYNLSLFEDSQRSLSFLQLATYDM